jgi:hypothetical protein
MVFNVTFNNISAISWRSVLFGGGTRSTRRKRLICHKSLTNSICIWSNTIDLSQVTDKNDWPVTSHGQIVLLYGVIRLTCHKSLTNSMFIWSNTIDLSQVTDKNDWPVTSHGQIVFLNGVIRLTCHKSRTNSIVIWSNTIDLSQVTDK